MPSIVWNRDPEEAYINPYEHDAQKQFVREAQKLLDNLYALYNRFNMTFARDDISLKKAIWMLQIDALDALRDGLESISTNRHRIAAQMFRVVVETLDLAAYLHSNSPAAQKNLRKWYENEVIQHKIYREYIGKTLGKTAENNRRDFYNQLSKFTHRTYRALQKSYSLGQNDLLVYDGHDLSRSSVLPHTIAAYYANLADLITIFCEEATAREILTQSEVDQARQSSLEAATVPRRFAIQTSPNWPGILENT